MLINVNICSQFYLFQNTPRRVDATSFQKIDVDKPSTPGDFCYMTYSEKLKNPLWQRKRLEVLNRDNFTCQICKSTDKNLQVHHRHYLTAREPWDYPNELLVTLCYECHKKEEELELTAKEAINALHTWGYFNFQIVKELNKLIESKISVSHG